MRIAYIAFLMVVGAASAPAAPLSRNDVATLRAMSERYVKGWLDNDRRAVMGVLAKDAVFIPHDGVKPHVGYKAIDDFWFPNGKAVGVVPAYTQTISGISGADNHATMYGRFDLTWQNDTKRYTWIGNFLIVARRQNGHWTFTHMMASDQDPTIEAVAGK